jgi:putative flippase GtrA
MFGFTFARYSVASLLALAVDLATFLFALRIGVSPISAAATGYTAGLAIHWLLCSRSVFASEVASAGAPRIQQQVLFVGSALVGLAATLSVVALGNWLGVEARLSKIVAIGVSFQATYLLRRKFVFA